MLIADTSAWIEFLNATGSAQGVRLRRALANREVVVIDPILMEVMSGAQRHNVTLTQRLLEAQHHQPLVHKLDWIDAATVYRELRSRGVTIRSQVDVLIAIVAIRLDIPVLHLDRDYGLIAQYTPLLVVSTDD
jgi:predicted nucleic acid-binding protein